MSVVDRVNMAYVDRVLFLSIYVCFISPCWCARILAITPVPLYSHQSYFHPLWRSLSERGHHITLYSTFLMNDSTLTNVREIDLSVNNNLYNASELFFNASENIKHILTLYWMIYYEGPEILLKCEAMQALIKSNKERFDLVMVDKDLLFLYVLAIKYDCPLIVLASMTASTFHYTSLGNPEALIDTEGKLYSKQLTFIERLQVLVVKYVIVSLDYIYMKFATELIKKYFDMDVTLKRLLSQISMVFENTNVMFHGNRPLLPTIVQTSGLNLYKKHPNLTVNIRDILDESSNGFIYISLGTIISDRILKTKVLIETFKKLPYTVLWKTDIDNFNDLPNNVHVSKWFPQFNILAHKNIKVFIMQGGIHSLYEAIYNQVPLIAIPIYLDQFSNAHKIESYGIGIEIDRKQLDEKSFRSKILDVAENLTYRDNLNKLHKIMTDVPHTGLEKAVFWTEYVIRHKGAGHFKSPLLEVPFYQLYFLDVIAIMVIAVVLLVYGLKLMFKFIIVAVVQSCTKKLKTS